MGARAKPGKIVVERKLRCEAILKEIEGTRHSAGTRARKFWNTDSAARWKLFRDVKKAGAT